MEVLNNSLNQTLQGNESLTGTEDVIIDVGYQIVVPLLIGLAMTGFLLNSIILVSILTSSLLMRTRGHDKYLNIIISMVSAIPPINDHTHIIFKGGGRHTHISLHICSDSLW